MADTHIIREPCGCSYTLTLKPVGPREQNFDLLVSRCPVHEHAVELHQACQNARRHLDIEVGPNCVGLKIIDILDKINNAKR